MSVHQRVPVLMSLSLSLVQVSSGHAGSRQSGGTRAAQGVLSCGGGLPGGL